ncbi:hypothetical protein NPIL_1911 [Nephila pilipes]|uniref:Uncharacterized protein n=1 Tax=Nephila pilipes TaxID=299642 RepID=A0A8X6U8Q1_NEPPI|nr:hypothetical protein NPIL_1911 [Nephila pilipes]
MDPAGKAGRMNRPSSRIRRQRSHEWKDYGSSSDNDEDLDTYRYDERQYEEATRSSQDHRKGDPISLKHPRARSALYQKVLKKADTQETEHFYLCETSLLPRLFFFSFDPILQSN